VGYFSFLENVAKIRVFYSMAFSYSDYFYWATACLGYYFYPNFGRCLIFGNRLTLGHCPTFGFCLTAEYYPTFGFCLVSLCRLIHEYRPVFG